METAARFFDRQADDSIRCGLCPRRCTIPDGHFGNCGVRGNKNGNGIIPYSGYITALAVDPVEKKPLYHYRPGSMVLSVGFAGCNLRCPFCQNWRISQMRHNPPGTYMRPADIIAAARRENIGAVAYTYSEPLVHAEFTLECMALARRRGIANVLVTNGCVSNDIAREILSLTDAANIDLKCFSADTYTHTLGGSLETVLAFIKLARTMDIHVEVTTLLVPGLNDSDAELDACADFLSSFKHIPWHLSAYHRDYRWNAPPTDPAALMRARKHAAQKLAFVYAGNISGNENNTMCLYCGAVVIRRGGYRIDICGLVPPAKGSTVFRCAQCGEKAGINQ